jgi:hypothetical protein
MNPFRRPDYQSEITQFIDQLKAEKPTLEAEQLAGRALLWDKAIKRGAAADMAAGSVAQKSYVYGSK